jgi:hypothetical protein
MTMASDDKKAKTSPAPKTETAATKKDDSAAISKSPSADATKAEGGEKTSDAPSGYSRGEGQKAVTQAYKDNWNAIYAKKKTKKKR